MSKKTSYFTQVQYVLFFFITLQPLNAMSIRSSSTSKPVVDNDSESEENVDVWFGPGFYYGIWFDDEPDYWQWRDRHRHYPSNHNYYNHDRPIHYHHNEDHHDGGERRGGGGRHGGGGHR